MGFWSNIGADAINKAKSTQGGLYLAPGNYTVQISKCKMIKTLDKQDAFVAEFTVIATDNVKIPVGAEPSYYVGMGGKYPDLALGNVADFFRAGLASFAEAHGTEHPPIEEIALDDEIAEAITGESNLLAGAYLDVYAFNKPTRDGSDFTRMKWRVPENIADLAAR